MAIATVITPADGVTMVVVDVETGISYDVDEISLELEEDGSGGAVLFDGDAIAVYPDVQTIDELESLFDAQFDILDDDRY